MYMVTHISIQKHHCEHKVDPWCIVYNLFDLSNVHIIPAGSRLRDFKIMVGIIPAARNKLQDFEIMVGINGSLNECASVSGK